ncbi:CRISPR-associated protein, Csd1 family [Bacteroides luti]|uniref:CRISPR-associated protein, Csd1 family n=1 Tax=Bacteroides luti TaxID=1297750 RepID=A0A1M5DNC0_9BACE|nr:type I-C CRISPR-associated protein Cas8c/Csd1 [Bacteroides luti]SHF68371.1 CRISPR-associated protein, Csd1 family [Bacteroides luti]
MILQALYEYYQRKVADEESNIAPLGFERKEIPFIIVIDEEGNFINLEDTREGENKRAKRFLVLKTKGRPGSNSWQTANVLWDHYGYVLAQSKDETDKAIDSAKKQNETFIKEVKNISNKFSDNKSFKAILKFYENPDSLELVKAHELFADCIKIAGCNISFRIISETELVAENEDLKKLVTDSIKEDEENVSKGVCLITGENTLIAKLHTATAIPGGKSGAKLVGFQKKSGYDSYYKEQGMNAPVSLEAEDAYTTALNTLLGKDSQNKMRLNDMTILFWAEKDNDMEHYFNAFFISPPKDDPDKNIREIRSFMESIYTGKLNLDGSTRFYILGLAPNAARISIRFWKVGKVSDLAGNIVTHFNDLMIIRNKNDEREFFSLFNLLTQVAAQFKMDNLPPNLVSSVMVSIINGTPYPSTLQQQCICRIRAEQEVGYIRAAILKAYINRKTRFNKNINEKEITMALDIENKNQGYLCGRLFAILEKIQEDAQPGINTTIKDRFYGAASSTPVAVFSRLLNMSNHHLEKLNSGKKIYYEKIIQGIMAGISSDGLPTNLSLDDQSRFAIGYYHQRQDLFISKKEN